MKTAIVFLSKYGTTAKVASMMQQEFLPKEVDLLDLSKNKNPELQSYECIIVGGSIYVGKPGKEFMEFCNTNKELLYEKRLGLFVCGMIPEKEKKEEELRNAYPAKLQESAKVMAFLGGEFRIDRMNFAERFIIKMRSKVVVNQSNIDEEGIKDFVRKIID